MANLNLYYTPLKPKDGRFAKILSHASESSLEASLMVLIIREIFWSSYIEILTKRHYSLKDGLFSECRQTPLNRRI